MNIPGHIDLRNRVRTAQWRERWFLQNGTHLWHAHPLIDLRNDEDRGRYLTIEYNRHVARRYLHNGRRVVNLAALRIRRSRTQRVK